MADDQKTEQDEVEAHAFEEQAELNRDDDGPEVEGHLQMEDQFVDQLED